MENPPPDDEEDLTILSGKEIEERIKKRTEYLENVMDTMAELLITVGKDGKIEMCNRAALEILGFREEEIIGKPLDTIFSSESEDHEFSDTKSKGEIVHGKVMDKMMRKGRIKDMEVYFSSKDGEPIPMSVSASVMRDSDDSVDGYVFVAKDIRERKRHEEKIKKQNEKLDNFAATISHDLRNPLSVARGNLEIEMEKNEENSEYLENIKQAHERMSTLIEDLLTLARQGETIDEVKTIDLEQAVKTAWENVDTKEAELETEDLKKIKADWGKLVQIFENLIRNSIEHGGEDVTVRVGSLKSEEDVEKGFYFEDDGPGIPEEERDKVFEHGFSTSGTGLGLSIVKEIVKAHGWEVTATESDDEGARFEIRIR